MIMEKPDTNPVSEYLSGLTARNERTSREALDLLAKKITWKGIDKTEKRNLDGLSAPWWQLSQADVVKIRESLANGKWRNDATGEPYSVTSVNRFINSLKGVLRQCWRQELMPAAEYLDAVSKLKTVPSRFVR
jgi:hypothetical protein